MEPAYNFDPKSDISIKVTTFFGLEEILAKELLQLGGKNITPFSRGVAVTGDAGFLYKLNLCLHTGLKVLVPLFTFKANDEDELYEGAKALQWEQFMTPDDTFMFEAVLNSEIFTHSQYISRRVKDALADRFREKMGRRPSVDVLKPTYRLYVHIYNSEVTIHLDSSGDPLYKRGYRGDIGEAPLKEVLAAGLVKLSGWERHQTFIDGMCGSGTIPIEAALLAGNIPAGYFRNDFSFMKWKNFDESLYEKIFESSINKIRNDKLKIQASDVDETMVKKARRNVLNAKVDDAVTVSHRSFFDIVPEKKSGVLILNPPYGERLPVKEIDRLYKEIGDKLKKDFSGFNAWILTNSPEAIKSVGLRPSRKIKIFNGSLECRFLKYEMYSGTKKGPRAEPTP